MAFAPIGIVASLIATTDAGYILFWILAAAALTYQLQHREKTFLCPYWAFDFMRCAI